MTIVWNSPGRLEQLAEHRLASGADRAEVGRTARKQTPRSSHSDWTPPADSRDPVALLEAQNASRLPWLVPIRHARMRVSPFTFFRGAARIMAADLASTPTSGLTVQVGGDAHLSNFGAYASPSRELVFDQNDFDETLPGPWEWDVKRLAASFFVAARETGFERSVARDATSATVQSYRTAMARFGDTGYLDLWYEHTTVENAAAAAGSDSAPRAKRLEHFERRALEDQPRRTREAGRGRRRPVPPPVATTRARPASGPPRGVRRRRDRGRGTRRIRALQGNAVG